jgi:1-deoxy-D-xylulose-5-phosphate reductoisomerase
MRRIVILGSTGSIGTQALDIVRRNPDLFHVVGLSAGGANIDLLVRQALEFDVEVIAVGRASAVADIQAALYATAREQGYAEGRFRMPQILAGPDASTELAAADCDVVLNGLAGAAGLRPTLAALEAGRILALANKESLIIGGPLVKALAAPGQIVPVDSEHSALAQSLRSGSADEVRRLVLTASGGPFRGWDRAALEGVTLKQALAHPTWDMGPLVTINSATLMNKGLELIEAHLLFDVPFDRIDVVVHPQSVVHSMVEFVDGSTIAQASPPDMRIPIALGLVSWPDRIRTRHRAATGRRPRPGSSTLDHEALPGGGARRAGLAGGTAPAVFNGADEACVAAFVAGELPFARIVDTVARVVEEHLDGRGDVAGSVWVDGNNVALSDVITADAWARRRAADIVQEQTKEGTRA